MKVLPLVLFISFGTAAQVPITNFNTTKDYAKVCNISNVEKPNTDPLSLSFGRTPFLVLYHALGCAGLHYAQGETCHYEIVQAGQCSNYHFKGGTSRRGAQICVPRGHGGLDNDWNCGVAILGAHFSFRINNGLQADVNHLKYKRPFPIPSYALQLTGHVNVFKY